jgi:hypothetical protein
VTGTLNDQNLVESIETRIANNILGDVPVRLAFSSYQDYGGITFPSRIVQTQAGHPTLELNVSDVQPNSTAANELSVPGPPPAGPPSSPVTPEPQKIVAYLPKQRMLVQADAFHPRPGAKPLASPPPFTVNLVENIRRLRLDVDRVVHLHGGIDAVDAIVRAAGL